MVDVVLVVVLVVGGVSGSGSSYFDGDNVEKMYI